VKVYLDNSVLNRPFDNSEITINRLETEILFWIIDLIKKDKIILVNSAMIEYENSLNPFPERKIFIEEILKLSKSFQELNLNIKKLAKILSEKFKTEFIDALHIASAQFARVDFFITSDYNLIKKYKGELKAISPRQFLQEYEKYKN